MLELPPAGTLVGLVKRELKGVATLAVKSPDDADAAAAFVAEHAGVNGMTDLGPDPRGTGAVTITPVPGAPGARISGLGHFRPDRVVTNDELAQIMDTNDEWIRTRVGIAERRFGWRRRHRRLDGRARRRQGHGRGRTAAAGHRHGDRRDLQPAQPGPALPPPRSRGALGIHAPGSFDLNAACAGFCYGLAAADHAIRSGAAPQRAGRRARRSSPTGPTRRTAPPRSSSPTVPARRSSAPVRRPEIGPVVWGSDETNIEAIRIDGQDGYFFQEGQTVFRWATTADRARSRSRRPRRPASSSADIDVARHPPGEPADHRRDREEADRGRGAARVEGRPRHRHLRQHLLGVGSDGAVTACGRPGRSTSGDLVLSVGFGAGLTYAGQVFICP